MSRGTEINVEIRKSVPFVDYLTDVEWCCLNTQNKNNCVYTNFSNGKKQKAAIFELTTPSKTTLF